MNVFTEPTIELINMNYADIVTTSCSLYDPLDICPDKEPEWD